MDKVRVYKDGIIKTIMKYELTKFLEIGFKVIEETKKAVDEKKK